MTRTFTPDDIAALITKLEAATGPDRDLDCAIGCSIGTFIEYPEKYEGGGTRFTRIEPDGGHCIPGNDPMMLVPLYTASIDAALTLVPGGLFWMAGHGKVREPEPLGAAQIISPADLNDPLGEGEATTVAIAICIAALKARASLARPNNES